MIMNKSFLWGGAVAANQYEGGYLSGGKGLAIQDVITGGDGRNNIPRRMALKLADGSTKFIDRRGTEVPDGAVPYVDEDTYYPSHVATDFYHHYKEDIALFGEMGFKTFRMSISWSRLFPTGLEQEPCEDGVKFYHQVFQECKKYGIKPLVTMIHYDIPVYLTETINGWESPKIIDYFLNYTKFIIDEYQDEVAYWITFNEINMVMNSSYLGGGMFVEKSNLPKETCIHQALHHQLIASALTVKYFHEHAIRQNW